MLIPVSNAPVGRVINVDDLHGNLVEVIRKIDELITEQHAANIMALWRVGELIHEIDNNSEKYLKPEQQSQHVIPSMLLFQAFDQAYRPEQFETARTLYETYSTPQAIGELIQKRCPSRPGWRITASHVQLLLTVADPDQRKVLEERCAQEAYTTKALSVELNEIRGPGKIREKSPTAPKGLKQRVYDVLEHQRKFIARSEKLWLSDDGLYDAIMNSPAEKITDAMRGYMEEITTNFDKLNELVQIHRAVCQKVNEFIAKIDEESARVAEEPVIIDEVPAGRFDKVTSITR
jgi:hypothetical protein